MPSRHMAPKTKGNKKDRAGRDITQWVYCLPSKNEDLSSIPRIRIKEPVMAAGEMAHCLRAVVALAKDPGWFPVSPWQMTAVRNSSAR